MQFAEDFLHYIWKFRLFSLKDIRTTNGKPVDIISVGMHNKHAGPDFENAKIRIGETVWAGNVEVHLRSSDWDKHRHQYNPAYNNVILHVVYEHDKPIYRNDGTEISTLALAGLIPDRLAEQYQQLMQNMNWIPCEKLIGTVDEFHIKSWLSRILVERLEEKSKAINALLFEYRGSWDDAFYIGIAKNFGFKTNALPFELLARSLPQEILSRHKNNPLHIEALIFGQAGLLNRDFEEEYPAKLKTEYLFLQKKYEIKPVDRYLWKFMRLRPQNFPTIRLAQFAALVVKSSHLFSKILDIKDAAHIKKLFEDLPVNPYWNTHYQFDKPTVPQPRQPGEETVNNILINTVVTFLFAYGMQMGRQSYINRAIGLLENIPAETNQIIHRFKETGVIVQKADSSQALLQLKSYYCDAKKCLHCGIGIKLLNQQ